MKFLQILVLIFGLVILANCQKAILRGTVTDTMGAVIPNVKVEAKNLEGKIISTRTSEGGHYQLELIEGEYNIEITSTPFDKFSVLKYWITLKMQLDVALQCRDCEIIEHNLSEPTQPVQTTETKISDKIQPRPLKELPKEQNETKRTASLTGKVYDQAGAIIPEAKISLTNKEGKKFETFSNNDGFYEITVSSGTYLIEAEYLKHQAWEKFRIEKYEMASAVKMILDITLAVDEEFTKKYGTTITADPIKQNKTKRKNKINKQ